MVIMLVLVVLSLIFLFQGIGMHREVNIKEERLHSLQAEYFSLSKVEREAAPTGSELNEKLVEIQQLPSDLLRLKLVGVGKILTGIFIILLGILAALVMMPKRLYGLMDMNRT